MVEAQETQVRILSSGPNNGRGAGIGRPGQFAKLKVQRWASGFESLFFRQLELDIVDCKVVFVGEWIKNDKVASTWTDH